MILEAYGFRINFKTLKFQQTGIISLNGEPKTVNLTMNNVKKNVNLPVRMTKLLPGYFEIILQKDGYVPWIKMEKLEAGQAINENEILLFLDAPKVTKLPENKAQNERIEKTFKEGNPNLIIKENEIWLNKKLVTRFSQPIIGAMIMRDFEHIIFQIGKEIRVIESDGSNNTKLIDLPSANPASFTVVGPKLVYVIDDVLYEAEIR